MEKELTNKRIIIKLITTILAVILLVSLMLISRNGINTLRPVYIIIIITVSLLSALSTALLLYHNKKSKVFNISYQINDFVFMLTLAVIVAQSVFTFWFFPAQVSQQSMIPTLENGQFVISEARFDVERFDVVVVKVDEEIALKSVNLVAGDNIVKRVVGLPGDIIYFEDSKLYINGEVVLEPYLNDLNVGIPEIYELYRYEAIPEGYYLVLGDNRRSSVDSRTFGLVSEESIKGHVIYKRIGFFTWERV